MKQQLKVRIQKLICFLVLMIMLITMNVSAKDNILSIYKNHPQDGMPFNVTNMFPGDRETNVYTIRVSYNGSIKIFFNADVKDGYEILAEVLRCKVVMQDSGQTLYDGLMRDMPDLEHNISAVNTTEDLHYEISVYLDTDVGNEYQKLSLIADFRWWAYTSENEEEYDPDDPGSTPGQDQPIYPSVPPKPDKPPYVVVLPGEGGSHPGIPDDSENVPTTPPDDDGGMTHPQVPDIPHDSDTPQQPGQIQPQEPTQPVQGGTIAPQGQKPTGELIDRPKTGDIGNPVLWIVLICISVFVILLLILLRNKKDKEAENNPLLKKLTVCIVVIVILAICLCITTFALVYSIVNVDENVFKTGTVDINLNNGDPIIRADEFLFEPGMTVQKDFFIKNDSSDAVYYKIYFDKISGGLAKVLDVRILDKKTGISLYNGKAKDLIRENCNSAELLWNETRTLTAEFHYPEASGNETQNLSLSFDMCAVATQQKNNPNREFD